MKQLNFQLLVDGNDLTDYVVSMERNHSFCNPISSLDLVLAPNLPIAVKPYQDVLFYEDGTKTFTGYSQEEIAARLPVEVSMKCNDVLIRAQDTWFTGPLVADGESAIAWIKNFLNRAGIRKISAGVSENYAIYPGYGWEFSTCLDAIVGCMQQCPYRVFADGDGIVHIDQARRGAVEHTINEYAFYNRVTNDCWIRNRAVVYGNGFVADKQTANPYLLPNEVRAAIVATGQIHQMSTADAIASRMLSEFSEPLDIKVIELEGSPDYKINQIVDFTDPGTGYHRSDCLITGINTIMNAEDGYVTEVTLDEKCVSFWGWDTPTPITTRIYTAMTDSGVYRSEWDYLQPNCNWAAYNEGLAGSSLTVHDLKISGSNVLWIATDGGLYKRPKDTDTWQRIGLPEPEVEMGEPDVSTILCSECWVCGAFHKNTVYILAHKVSEDKVWLYKTINEGKSWIWLELSEEVVTWTEMIVAGLPNWQPDTIAYTDEKLFSFGWGWPDSRFYYWDGATWNNIGVGNERPRRVYSDIALSDNGETVYITGSFPFHPGFPGGNPPRIGYWDGAWHVLGDPTANTNAAWYSIMPYGDDIVVGGIGSIIGPGDIEGVPVTGLGIWDGLNWAECAGGVIGPVYQMAVHETFLYIANVSVVGFNTSPLAVNKIACWDGNTWYGMLGGVTGGSAQAITSLVTGPSGEVYVAGDFTYAGNVPVNYIAKWYNGNWHALGDGLSNPITNSWNNMTVASNGDLYVMHDGYVKIWDGFGWEVIPGQFTDFAVANQLILALNEDDDLIYVGGDFNRLDGAAFDRKHAEGTISYLPLQIPTEGRTHLLDADSADGEFIYIAALTNAGFPIILRVESILTDRPRVSYRQGVGTWGGVMADLYVPGAIWIYGDFGPYKIRLSENYGYYPYEDKTCGLWGANELVRAMVPTLSAATDYVAILNVAEEAWATQTDGDLWSKAADLTFPPNFGRDLLDGMGIFIGDEGPDADILRHSIRLGKNWTEQNTGIPVGKRMANVVEEIDYI